MMFKKIWHIWKEIALFIWGIIGFIIASILYCIVVTPFGIAIRIFTDYFKVKEDSKSMWIKRNPKDLTLEDMRKQY